MKPLIEADYYRKSIYRTFGMFPFLLLLVVCVIAYGVNLIRDYYAAGLITNYAEPQLIADSFFWGVVVTVALFYIARLSAIKASEKSKDLMDMEESGWYITCMSHNTFKDMLFGNIIMTEERLYFQPDRQMTMDLAFDYKDYSDFTVTLGDPMKSIGLFLLTGKKQMVEFKDPSGKVVGSFIIAEAEESIKLIKAHM